jgi:hypothetical protein
VDDRKKERRPARPDALAQSGERRRISRIVHDDRGNASVEWVDAPADYRRPVLEIQDPSLSLAIEADETFDPYARRAAPQLRSVTSTGKTSRTDLRKLSEWIKLKREIEAQEKAQRQRQGPGEAQGEAQGEATDTVAALPEPTAPGWRRAWRHAVRWMCASFRAFVRR